MTRKLIDETSRYCFERIHKVDSGESILKYVDKLSTTFIHRGSVTLRIQLEGCLEKRVELSQGQGFILAPGVSYSLHNFGEFVAYAVSSEIDQNKPIIEIIEVGNDRKEVELKDYKIITNPKRVEKPWGHELWISWFKDYHVLKQIGMNKGNQSSLQFHREKLETNYLESGNADVIEGYRLDPQASEEEVQNSSKGIDFNKYKKEMSSGNHWTSQAGVVHRVISVTDYLAYEVSTPELDDVIRLKDDSGRISGRINSEHIIGGNKKNA